MSCLRIVHISFVPSIVRIRRSRSFDISDPGHRRPEIHWKDNERNHNNDQHNPFAELNNRSNGSERNAIIYRSEAALCRATTVHSRSGEVVKWWRTVWTYRDCFVGCIRECTCSYTCNLWTRPNRTLDWFRWNRDKTWGLCREGRWGLLEPWTVSVRLVTSMDEPIAASVAVAVSRTPWLSPLAL